VGSAGMRGAASHGSGLLLKSVACAPGQPRQSHGASAQDPQYEVRNGYGTKPCNSKRYCCHRSILLVFALTGVPAGVYYDSVMHE